MSSFHGYIWLSWFARKKLICWSALQALLYLQRREQTVMPVLELHQLHLERAAQAAITIAQPLAVVASQQWCSARPSPSPVMLCMVIIRMISEKFSASTLFPVDGGSSITVNWLPLQHKLLDPGVLMTILADLGTASGKRDSKNGLWNIIEYQISGTSAKALYVPCLLFMNKLE